ncbi:L-aminoadipate-semialdehyde dehydrogenase-phosphopantetheinyl transferase-like [Benincasa hispida]|uniref:L-aminoadipate-semialdehyde dehydrogenase-phosphopantetheinyl transferase-like n=1 Tax=Benincasa hispida TaxID=102211 RepID=UPI0018FFC0A3|nr:L-aminoadipate-semialdehyde dehydrogenase-phosphopantetheinyl transferase-like [Benincasa hispida]
MERGVQRWAVDISEWNPSPHNFSFALTLLPRHEHSSILRFFKMEDRKRALVSRLLQYALVHNILKIPFDEITIKRTLEGKPYLDCDKLASEFPNFNFNVSHHGDYVVIASEPLCLVGLDVVSYTTPQNGDTIEFVKSFSSYFSSLEWKNIMIASSSSSVLVEFYRYWCLKEAYVKAIGSGIASGLEQVEFRHVGWNDILVKVGGEILKEWRFWISELGNGHCVAVAKGHPRFATKSYRRTLRRSEFDPNEYRSGLLLPNVSFVSKTVEQLISISME